ncbi:MAG: trypsin-like peptidase domain-containing protein [Nitrospiraceae bacterium]
MRCVCALIAPLVLCAGSAHAADAVAAASSSQPAQPKALTVPAVVSAVRPSVVTIMSRGVSPSPAPHSPAAGSGSGIVIDAGGFILTNNHLVEGVKSVVVGLPSGRLTPGRVAARDLLLDLALIKVAADDLVAATLSPAPNLEIGETVVAIGHPLALKGGSSVSVGVVSAVERAVLAPDGETLYDLIQTDAAINPGSSGGPLVDLAGHVVGINVAVAPSAQAISYALSMRAVAPHLQSMMMRGSVMRPDLGFIPLTMTPSVAAGFDLDFDRGIVVAHVVPGAASDTAGLRMGDLITAVDHRPIYNVGDFWHLFLGGSTQEPVQLTVRARAGERTVTLPRSTGGHTSGQRSEAPPQSTDSTAAASR